jgi:hypothetical protein
MTTYRRLAGVVLAVTLLAAACGDDGDTSSDTTAAAPAVASLDAVTDFEGLPVDPSAALYGPGEISVSFYLAGDVWAAVYDGLGPDDVICPGNSVETPDGAFDGVSNSPVAEGSCDDIAAGSTVLDGSDGNGVLICGDQVGYLTIIPSDAEGTLYASMAEFAGPEEGVSYVGTTAVDAGAPEIDPADLSC